MIAFFTQAYLARTFLPNDFGEFNFVLVTATLISTFGFQGVSDITLRLRGKTPVKKILASAAILSAFGIVATCLILVFFPKYRLNQTLMIAFLPYIFAQGGMFIGMAYWQLRDRPVGISLWPLSQHVLKFICIIPIILLSYPLVTIPIVWTISLAPFALYGVYKLKRTIDSISEDHHKKTPTSKLVFSAFPFSVSRTLEYADIQLPVILAMGLIGATASGFAAASLVFIQGLLLLPISIFQRLYRGRFHDWAVSDPMKLKHVARVGAIWMVCIGIILSVCLNLTSTPLLTMVFGTDFIDANYFLAVISLALPMWFTAIPLNAALVSKRNAKVRVYLQLISIAMVTLVSLLLVPSIGLPGIGWAVCAGQCVLVFGAATTLYYPNKDLYSEAS